MSHPGQLVNPRALGPDREESGTAGGHLENSDMGASFPGQLVDPAGPQTWAYLPGTSNQPRGPWTHTRVTRDSWSTLQDFGHGLEAPGTADRPRGHRDLGPS